MDKLYTVDDVAGMLRVSPRTVYRYLRCGELGGSRIGGVWRFREDDVRRFVEGGRAAR